MVSSIRAGAELPPLVERLAAAQLQERLQLLRIAEVWHPDHATGVELLEAAAALPQD